MSLQREIKTVDVMIRLYCSKHHTGEPLCEACRELFDYVKERLEKCPFMPDKPVCKNCTVHCYSPDMRKRITEVMRFSGPRMMVHHPIMTLRHFTRIVKKKEESHE